jgi:hypothetical protein
MEFLKGSIRITELHSSRKFTVRATPGIPFSHYFQFMLKLLQVLRHIASHNELLKMK